MEQLVPESALYTELVQKERKLDAILTRKRLEIQASLAKTVSVWLVDAF
jgi:hypothetical protein